MKKMNADNSNDDNKSRAKIRKTDTKKESTGNEKEQRDESRKSMLRLTLKMQNFAYKMNHERDNEEHYKQFRKLFYDNLGSPGKERAFDREEKFKNFSILANYCIQKFSKDSIKEAFEVYKCMINHNIYSEFESDYMHLETYRNIIKVCDSLVEYDWLREFHKKYTQLLNPKYLHEMSSLTDSYILFHEKKFLESLQKIEELDINFALSKTDLRHQKLKLYFEIYSFYNEKSDKTDKLIEYSEKAENLIKSYNKFLKETKEIAEPSIALYKSFLDYYSKLFKIKSDSLYPEPAIELEIIKRELKDKKMVQIKWLLEKIDEMLNTLEKK